MSTPIEDYALLADLRTGPLVSRDGSIDWLCLPRFDSPALCAALLGDERNGRWKLSIVNGEVQSRRYVDNSFVLETTWRSPTGVAVVRDFLPPSSDHADLVRLVECVEGEVVVRHDVVLAFEYGQRIPWARIDDDRNMQAIAGPNALQLTGPELSQQGDTFGGDFSLICGQELSWVLTWAHSYHQFPAPVEPHEALAETLRVWRDIAGDLHVAGCPAEYGELVSRSLLVLLALTHSETGGIVAAPTTSLPEDFGGVRNWDYRYTWLRDAAFTIEAFIAHGHVSVATRWRDWLLRAIAGNPDSLRIMYGIGGEQHLPEFELDHLAGHEQSRPVRVGNAAVGQYQADVAGEVMLALAKLRAAGGDEDDYSWGMQKNLIQFCIDNLARRDCGIWEVRGEPQYFTHGRVMMWAAFDCGIKAVETAGLDGPVDEWREYRDRLEREIWDKGFNQELNSFTQTYANRHVDASLLQIPHTGFVDYDHPAMLGTVNLIERELMSGGGMLHRYNLDLVSDGLSGDESSFVMCSFWLVEQYARSGRRDDARRLMDQLVATANDLGLLAEQYDENAKRLAGNFPQAFSHLSLIRAADALSEA